MCECHTRFFRIKTTRVFEIRLMNMLTFIESTCYLTEKWCGVVELVLKSKSYFSKKNDFDYGRGWIKNVSRNMVWEELHKQRSEQSYIKTIRRFIILKINLNLPRWTIIFYSYMVEWFITTFFIHRNDWRNCCIL